MPSCIAVERSIIAKGIIFFARRIKNETRDLIYSVSTRVGEVDEFDFAEVAEVAENADGSRGRRETPSGWEETAIRRGYRSYRYDTLDARGIVRFTFERAGVWQVIKRF